MMIDENRSDELALNFESAANRDELETARQELAQEVAASGTPATAPATPPTISVISAPRRAPAPAVAVTPVPAAMPDPVLRSRQPMNRPAGTPPITPAHPVTAAPANAGNGTYGATLRSVRESLGYDVRAVEKGTQIATRYIEAIEREDLDALPPRVYVIAYIRTLCRFYNIGRSDADKMVAKLKEELEYPCNDELINSVEVDNSGAEVNEKRLRQIFLVAAGSAILVVVVIGLVLFLFFRKPAPTPEQPVPEAVAMQSEVAAPQADEPVKFDSKTIYPLLEPATPKLVKLPVAE